MLTSKIMTGEDVKTGDLITIGPDGLGRFAVEPGTPGAEFRPLVQIESLDIVNETRQKYFIGIDAPDCTADGALASVYLSNGNYALAFTAGGQVSVATYAGDGQLLNNKQLGFSDNVHLGVAMVALENNTFAVAFSTGTPAMLNVMVVGNNGSIINDAVVVPNAVEITSVNAAVLADGSFVVAYAVGDKRQPAFVRFTPAGHLIGNSELVGSEPVEAALHSQSVSVCALIENRFVVTHGATDGVTGVVKAFLYDNNGQLLSDFAQAGENLSLCDTGPFITSAALIGGGFAVTSYGGIGPGFQLSIFNNDCQQLSTTCLDPFDQFNQPNRMAVAGLANGNVGVVWSGPYTNGAVYSPEGAVIFPRSGYGLNGGSVALTAAPEGAVVTYQGRPDVVTNKAYLHTGLVNNLLYGDVTTTTLESGKAFSRPIGFAADIDADGRTSGIIIAATNGNVQLATVVSYKIPQQTLVGVAVTDADKGTECEIQINGAVELRVPFKQPCAVDYNSNPTPGQKMSVIGNCAILKGIQA